MKEVYNPTEKGVTLIPDLTSKADSWIRQSHLLLLKLLGGGDVDVESRSTDDRHLG